MIEERLYKTAETETEATARLFDIVRILREKCPWDSVQTHQSLRICMIEEAYEACDAMDKYDIPNLREELGDVMLQVALNGVIAEENEAFTLTDLINEECEKMIRRHPHIFEDEEHKSVDKVLEKWENVKSKEHGELRVSDRLASVPDAFPALLRANKLLTKVQRAELTPEDYMEMDVTSEDAVSTVAENLQAVAADLSQALTSEDREDMGKKVGDLLFLVADAARIAGIDPEDALNARSRRYVEHFAEEERTN